MRIKIVNLNKVYPGGKKALKDLNLEIEPGMFGLLGPNGAGKTSLMRILMIMTLPRTGKRFAPCWATCHRTSVSSRN